MPPKSQTTDSLWVGRWVLGTLRRWPTKKPSLFKQPDFGIRTLSLYAGSLWLL